ncbi:MAG TPA: hypothetical protein VNV86_04275 [Candidatus Acidoferrum sp.]|nr:hypothetical protein [Candidatus Acidoferrum sp.]
MFTWICPQCGREVPPSYTECPDCAERAKQAAAQQPPAGQQPPPQQGPPPQQPQQPPPGYPPPAGPQQPPQYYAPPQQQYTQQQQYPPNYGPPPQHYPPQQQYGAPPPHYPQQHAPHRAMNMPVWLMTILFALAIGGVVSGVYWLLPSSRGSAGNGPAPSSTVESPNAKAGAKTNALQKHIEVAGVRFVTDPKKKGTLVKFVVTNHSDSEISGLAGNVTIWGRTQKSEEDAQGTFSFTTNLGPLESQELTVPLKTKLKVYELPDWQNITTDVQITAPGA